MRIDTGQKYLKYKYVEIRIEGKNRQMSLLRKVLKQYFRDMPRHAWNVRLSRKKTLPTGKFMTGLQQRTKPFAR
jgi:hypothetical protein